MPFTIGMGASLSESAATLLSFALLPIAKVFVMCALGLLMATSYIGILNAPARKQLTKVRCFSARMERLLAVFSWIACSNWSDFLLTSCEIDMLVPRYRESMECRSVL